MGRQHITCLLHNPLCSTQHVLKLQGVKPPHSCWRFPQHAFTQTQLSKPPSCALVSSREVIIINNASSRQAEGRVAKLVVRAKLLCPQGALHHRWGVERHHQAC